MANARLQRFIIHFIRAIKKESTQTRTFSFAKKKAMKFIAYNSMCTNPMNALVHSTVETTVWLPNHPP